MKILQTYLGKKLGEIGLELLYGAHLVSFGTIGLVLGTIMIFGLWINTALLLIAYLIPQIVYRYNYLRELGADAISNPERVKHVIEKKTRMQFGFYACSVLIAVLLVFTNWMTAMLVFVIVFSGIMYTEYFKWVQVLGFKNYYTAFFWAILILIVPLSYGIDSLTPFLFISLFVFMREVVNNIFFDIKDIESDRADDVRTIPVYLGREKTIKLLHIINLLSLLPIFLGIYLGYLPAVAIFLGFTFISGIIYLNKGLTAQEENLRLFSYIVVDGESTFWPIIIFIGRLLT